MIKCSVTLLRLPLVRGDAATVEAFAAFGGTFASISVWNSLQSPGKAQLLQMDVAPSVDVAPRVHIALAPISGQEYDYWL
jgi:hypothetical protein